MKPGVNQEAGRTMGRSRACLLGSYTQLRRDPLPGQGPTAPKRLRLTLRRDLSPSATFHQEKSYDSSYCSGHKPTSGGSAGSQASPPAHRVQDRRAVLLGKSLEVVGTALPAAGMYPLPQASAGRSGLLTVATGPHASSPSSTTSHQPTRHELNQKAHVFPALAEARFRQGSQESNLKQQCHPEPVVRPAAGAGGPHPFSWQKTRWQWDRRAGTGGTGGDTEQTLVRKR